MEIEFILYVSDQEAAKAFYERLLEMKPVLHVPGMTEFILGQRVKLGLMPEKGIVKILEDKTPDPASGSGIPRCELYLKLGSVGAKYDLALALGANPVSPPAPRDWGDEVAYVSDPDGHILAFAAELGT